MNIFFIGSRYINSVMMQLPQILPRIGCKVVGYIDSFGFAKKYKQANPEIDIEDYFKGDKYLPLSFYEKLIPEKAKFDYIFVEQNGFNFTNDVDIPVIYYHRDTPTPLFMKDMDILLYRFMKMEEVISKDFPEVWNNGILKGRWLNGVDVYEFLHKKPKTFKGINWVGWSKTFEYYWGYPDQIEYYKYVRAIVEEATKRKLVQFHPHGINYHKHKDILQRSEAVLIVPGNEAYVTRRIYEAALSKTLIVLWVQNDKAMEIFRKTGLVSNVNCIMFHTVDQLEQIKNKWDEIPIAKANIVSRAFEWVISNHLWLHRGQELIQLLQLYEKYKKS